MRLFVILWKVAIVKMPANQKAKGKAKDLLADRAAERMDKTCKNTAGLLA